MAIWLPYVFHYVLDEQEGLLQANLWIQTKCTKLGIRENVVLRPSQYLLFQSQHCKHQNNVCDLFKVNNQKTLELRQ